jgi:hypothetical protein
MKRWIMSGLLLYFAYWDLRWGVEDWLPAWGAVYGGQVIGQTVLLGVLALIVSGTVVWTGYEILGWMFD